MTISPQPSRKRRASGWTDERRARHSAAMRQWAPWTKSTGPRTPEGKHISSLNALKHGAYSRPARQFYQHLRVFLLSCRDTQQKSLHFWRNELLKKRKLVRLKGTLKRCFKKRSVQPAPISAPTHAMPRGGRQHR